MRGWFWCLVIGLIAGLIFGLLWGKMVILGLVIGMAIGMFIGSATQGFMSFTVLFLCSLAGTVIGLAFYVVGLGLHALNPSIWTFVLFGLIACSLLRMRLMTLNGRSLSGSF